MEVVYEKNDQNRLKESTETVESFKWYSTGLYMGTDYTFTWNDEKYDVHLHKDQSVTITRTRDGANERTVLLSEEAGRFLEMMTGGEVER